MLSLPGCPWLQKANVLTQLPDFLFLGGDGPWVLLTFCVSFTMINSSVSTLYWLQMPQILPLWPVCTFSMVFERAEPPSLGSLIPLGLRKPIPTGQCPTSCRALSLQGSVPAGPRAQSSHSCADWPSPAWGVGEGVGPGTRPVSCQVACSRGRRLPGAGGNATAWAGS